ncbi:hypothetical protein ABFS83_03G040200 [Erythranthe nasuta]
MDMDPRIWSGLPDHLLERVLSFLPLKTFLSLRSTCKHFKSILSSPLFISKHSSSSSSSSSLSSSSLSSFILLSHPQFPHNKYPLYNTVTNSWCPVSLSIPSTLKCSGNTTLLTSSNGLLCFSAPDSYCFVVCNLLTKSIRRVKYPFRPFAFELLTLVAVPTAPNNSNNNIAAYKLFMLSSSSAPAALVYDSEAGAWREYAARGSAALNGTRHQNGVFFDGRVFFATSRPFSVACFDLETGSWERSSALGLLLLPPAGGDEVAFARLVSDGDRRMYLVGGVGVSGISRSVKVWEYIYDREDATNRWAEIETLPEMLCKKFLSVCYHNYEHVYCFWHKGLICVCCYTWPEILYYKVCRRTWHWLPKCPSLPHKWSCGFKWFSFNPHLYANV